MCCITHQTHEVMSAHDLGIGDVQFGPPRRPCGRLGDTSLGPPGVLGGPEGVYFRGSPAASWEAFLSETPGCSATKMFNFATFLKSILRECAPVQ